MLLVALAIFGLAVGLYMVFMPGEEYQDIETSAIGEAVDRAIALAAALPQECVNCDMPFVPALDGDEICQRCIGVGHGQIRAGRFIAAN